MAPSPRLLLALLLPSCAQSQIPYTFPNRVGLIPFDQAKLGLFMHWGPISQAGTEISFPLACPAFPCTVQSLDGTGRYITIDNATALQAQRSAYRALAGTFNPTAFDPDAMAALAHSAGFRYFTPIVEHCDGFDMWNSSANAGYSIMSTPYGRDIFAMLQASFKSVGIRVGAYWCPSTWNQDTYWAPNALNSLGDCCSPNYDPLTNASTASTWAAYVAHLHEQMMDFTDKYAPDHWWIDSGTYPLPVDTHIEDLIPYMRAANPEVVVTVRDGGLYHDYVQTGDHTEATVEGILGISYIASDTVKFEVPATLGQQWDYDPNASYKSAAQVIVELVAAVSKGGNLLMNIGPDSTGVWAPAAVTTLVNMSSWMAYNAECIHNTSTVFPFEYHLNYDNGLAFTQYFTYSRITNATYVILIDNTPTTRHKQIRARGNRAAIAASLAGKLPLSTKGARALSVWDANTVLTIPHLRTPLLAAPPASISLLTATGPQPIDFVMTSSGVTFNASQFLPSSDAPVALVTYFKRYSASQVDNAPCATRDCSVYTQAGYAQSNGEGFCLRGPAVGEPSNVVTLWYDGNDDNMGAVTAPNDGQAWEDIDIECYAYANNATGRWALEVWRSVALDDYWTLASPASRAAAQAAGYTFVNMLGYVLSTAPPGNNDTVASWGYVLKVSF